MRTPRGLSEWFGALPERGPYRCVDCGKEGPKAYVQPQAVKAGRGRYVTEMIDGTPLALCAECITARNTRARERVKVRRAAEPRCECAGCARRGNYHVGAARVLLCGRHWKRAQHAYNPGWLGLFQAPALDRAAILRLAEGGA